MLREVPVNSVVSALGSAIKNAYFWCLCARGNETSASAGIAALSWERFIRHAVDENLFAVNSAEAAAVWLHIAELLSPLSRETLLRIRVDFGRSQSFSSSYAKQPPEIARLQPNSDIALADFVLSPGRGFEQAALIRPESSTFAKWIAWADRFGLPAKQREEIASVWQKARPGDVQPLLILSALAESRNALSLAIKRVADAEAIDPMNQQVRQARVRLTLSITWRHFADGKAHLVEKDLAELAALPGMNEGNRASVLESIRGAWHQMRGDMTAENTSFQKVADRMGFLAATVMFESIKKMAKVTAKNERVALPVDVQPTEVAQAQATALRLGDDLRMKIYLPVGWTPIIIQVLKQRPCPLSNADLLILGRGALHLSEMETVYLVSSAGLARSNPPAITARFLLLRANCLDQYWQRPRALQCLRAALELAQQAHDQDLISDIFAAVDRDPMVQSSLANSRDGNELDAEALQQVVETETRAQAYPKHLSDIDSFLVEAAIPQRLRRSADFEDDDWDWDDTDDEEGSAGPGLAVFDDEDDDWDDEFPDLNKHQLNDLMNAAGVSNPEEMPKNLSSIVAAMAKMMGKKINQAELKLLIEHLSNDTRTGLNPQGLGKSSKQQKKKRR